MERFDAILASPVTTGILLGVILLLLAVPWLQRRGRIGFQWERWRPGPMQPDERAAFEAALLDHVRENGPR